MPRPHLCVLGVLLSLAAAVSVAAATESADEWDVGERPRPAYDPAGVRLGGFLLLPSLELGIGRDDNIYSHRAHKERDTVRSVRPRLFAASQWRNHEIHLDMGADVGDFAKADSEDITDWFATSAGRLDISRDAWVRGSLGTRELHEERGDPDSPSTSVRPVSRSVLDARFEAYRRFNRVALGLESGYMNIAYDDSVDAVTGRRLVQSDRDRGEGEVSARVALSFAPCYETYVRTTRYVRRYDRVQGEDLYDRDSDGTQVVTGLRVDLGAVFDADLFGGYRKQTYDKDDRLRALEGATFGGSLTWNPTSLTTVRGIAERSVNESTLRRASGYFSSAFELAVDHELRRNLLLGARARLTTNRYEGIARTDDIVTGGVQAVWLISRRVHTDFGYRFRHRDSTVERDDYDRSFVYLDVRLNF